MLDASLAGQLAAGVKIRNLIGHAYVEIDPVRLQAAANELHELLEGFVAQILSFADSSSRPG